MQYKQLLFIVVMSLIGSLTFSQSYSHYENTEFSPFERYQYQPGSKFHTSIRQVRMDEMNQLGNTDSILYDGLRIPSGKLNFWKRIFHDDLLKYEDNGVKIVINPLFNFEAGRENKEGKSTFVNSRGLFIKGDIGKHVSFYTDFVENQATFPNYIDQFANDTQYVPGQGQRKNFGSDGHDYAQATGYLSFDVANYFNFQIGNGKNFIGDGHRSLLLSDAACSYPYVKFTTTFKNVKYMMMWNKMLNYEKEKDDVDHRFPAKYGVFHYLDWSIGKRLTVGLFESVIWAAEDSTGHRGFDMHYLNPIIFFRPVEHSQGSPDNVTMGLNMKYVLAKWATVYGQFVLGEFKFDEVKSGNKWWANKHGFQLGVKTFDLFGLKNLDVQAEYNQVRPYTYSHYTSIYSYGHLNQPLAHPFGANFREGLGILKYKHRRWRFRGELMLTKYGEDVDDEVSWGKDVFKPNVDRPYDYGHSIGQGLTTTVYNADVSVSYLINPRNMFNIVAGARVRQLTNDQRTEDTQFFYFGIRTSLKNLYYDF